MPAIRTLSDEVARRIAAGEVVERPASVVKELMENALDAGARSVTVLSAGAGETLLEVRDDGAGMGREDIEMAPRNFATSKIRAAEDLQHIATFGFRGEALASISAVSRFEIVSSDGDAGEGWRLRIEGKAPVRVEPAPREHGTTVRVQDLFYNTPARRRFLKSPLTERKRILETVLSFALILPESEIHYVDDGRHVLDLLPAPSWRERVAAVMGATTMKHLVPVEAEAGGMRLRGFVSLPAHTRANRGSQFFFVNRRAVRERTMSQALHDAMRNVIPPRRFPVAVLSLEVTPDAVDVNVHPTKMEVRIRDERALFSLVQRAVRAALSSAAEASLAVGASPSTPADTGAGYTIGSAAGAATPPSPSSAKVVSLRERIRDAYGDAMDRHGGGPSFPNPQLSLRAAEPPAGTREAIETIRNRGLGDEGLFWQLHGAYIFIQVRGGVVVIDQHAAHERVIFDTTRRQLEGSSPPSQQILFSIPLELSLSELEIFRSGRDLFRAMGFDLEPFGGKSILVRGYPAGLRNWEDGRLLLQIFDDLVHERVPGDTLSDKLVASFACRSAIKAGQRLSVEEMRLLADQLFEVENPYSCPHGRPTIHRLSVEEIERWFHRR